MVLITMVTGEHMEGLPFSGNFCGRKLSRIGEKYIFRGENFRGLLAFAAPMDATAQISQRKLSHIATKP